MTRSEVLEASLERFVGELQRWGARMNLVGSTQAEEIARHIEDSLAAAELLPQRARVVDLGSGAGFPGLPIALARPDLQIVLVEIREKRVAFLRHVARELAPGVEVRASSIETPDRDGFDFALLRAVAKPEASLELGLPWVKAGGEVWIWAGPGVELPGAAKTPLRSGGNILRARAADFSRGTS
ncbi:MAG TPA: 16S rRNA (guanine(527)-N(7))-methyltransferase RsmG [Myxococcota bacterium]|nr:16S rRNA (guanine(527)-N(7))-methyltransferase RsmG [Myxococcota bacterium]